MSMFGRRAHVPPLLARLCFSMAVAASTRRKAKAEKVASARLDFCACGARDRQRPQDLCGRRRHAKKAFSACLCSFGRSRPHHAAARDDSHITTHICQVSTQLNRALRMQPEIDQSTESSYYTAHRQRSIAKCPREQRVLGCLE
jgi:hypothetical protein